MASAFVYRWYRLQGIASASPQPPRAHVAAMLAEAEAFFSRGGWRPLRCDCQSWTRPPHVEPRVDGDAVARIRFALEPGDMPRPMRTWFVWQHPKWLWSAEAFPLLMSIDESKAQ